LETHRKKAALDEIEMDKADLEIDKGKLHSLNVDLDNKYKFYENELSNIQKCLKNMDIEETNSSQSFLREVKTIVENRLRAQNKSLRAPPNKLLEGRASEEQIQWCLETQVWIFIKKEEFLEFCANKQNNYRTMSTLKAGFDRYLKRLEILENNGSNPVYYGFNPLYSDVEIETFIYQEDDLA
jgi:hypothetical protein